jgi:hypothetical protein
MIYTATCIMFWMRANPLRWEVGGGWALEFESFLGPVKLHRADRRVPFGAQETQLNPFQDDQNAFPLEQNCIFLVYYLSRIQIF